MCALSLFFCKQKTAYEWRMRDWSSDVCSSALRDAGRRHIDQKEGDALLRLRRGVGAHERENPVGVLRESRPGLVAVHDIMVAVAHRSRADIGEVRPGPRLRIALAPPVVARRSEEHTSELQSLMRISYAVFCLNKKKHK